MKVYLNSITGIDDAIVALHMSKRSWTKELDTKIRKTVQTFINPKNGYMGNLPASTAEVALVKKFNSYMEKLLKYGVKHTTLLRFIDMSFNVEGLHRAGQDDWDSHAMRFQNRIVRSSTAYARYDEGELSEFYEGKIIPTDVALKAAGLEVPQTVTDVNGTKYVKCVNGYVREDLKESNPVLRGLYMLSIPSNFIFRVNLTEFAHVYKLRNKHGGANPEVQDCCEMMADLIQESVPWFDRELLMKIQN